MKKGNGRIVMKKILVFLLVLNSTFISNASEIGLFLQSFFPFRSIAFSYFISDNIRNNNTGSLYSKGKILFDTIEKSYKVDKLTNDNTGYSYSYSDGILASGVITKNRVTSVSISKDRGLTDFPLILSAWIDPYNQMSPILNKQTIKDFSIRKSSDKIEVYNTVYCIVFDKKSLKIEEVNVTFRSSSKKIYIGQRILFRKHKPVNNIAFPTEMQFIYYNINGEITFNSTYNLSNISFNDITKKQLKITASDGTLIRDRLRNKTYITSDLSTTSREEVIIEKLLNEENQ